MSQMWTKTRVKPRILQTFFTKDFFAN